MATNVCLLSWGTNSHGQLGLGHDEDQMVPQEVRRSMKTRSMKIRTMSGGGGHSVCVTDDGQVLVCGQNQRGQLGLGHTEDVSTFQICPGLQHRITDVACGWDFTLLLTDNGKLLVCGSNRFGQLGVGEKVHYSTDLLAVESVQQRVVSAAAGLRHSLAVTESGSVFQWGTGLLSPAKRVLGPLPVPSHLNSKIPTLVPGLEGRKAHVVKSGAAHCVCLTDDGEVLLWGSNKHGELLVTEAFVSLPTPVKRECVGGEKTRQVWSGWTHVVAQTASGRVFTWGRHDYGQLGRPWTSTGSETQEVRRPQEVKALSGASQIACGSEHNLAVLGGRLLSWGWNEHGMCGDASEIDVQEPQVVSGVGVVLLVGCGAGHSLTVGTKAEQKQPPVSGE